MLNKNEMLNFIAQNAEMGCCGIAFIKGYAKDEKLQKALRTQMIEYGKIYSNANNILKSDMEQPYRISYLTRSMTRHFARRCMDKDNTDSHIAQMMITGNPRGVNKIVDRMRQYDKKDSKVQNLAERLLQTQYNNIQQMTEFL